MVNPNSVMQMKAWLSENSVEAESLGKKDVAKLIDDTDGQVEEALVILLFPNVRISFHRHV